MNVSNNVFTGWLAQSKNHQPQMRFCGDTMMFSPRPVYSHSGG
jgi:hypothetical protein